MVERSREQRLALVVSPHLNGYTRDKVDSQYGDAYVINGIYEPTLSSTPSPYAKYCNQSTGDSFGQFMNMFSHVGWLSMGLGTNQNGYQMQNLTQQKYPSGFQPPNPKMRTIYIGDLPEDVSYSDIANHIHVGALEQIKIVPEKNCAFATFVDPKAAHLFYSLAQYEGLKINGKSVKVGSGRPSSVSPPMVAAIEAGASRTVFIGNYDSSISESSLQEEFSLFGPVECIQIIPERKVALVHMVSILAAKKAIEALSTSPSWSSRKIEYGEDRCNFSLETKNRISACLTQFNKYESLNTETFSKNRTVYIGNIQQDVTIKELCDTVRGGNLQNIKYIKDRNIAFATFISPLCALKFYLWASSHLTLRGKKLKIGWGKPSPLPEAIRDAVKRGASRSILISNIDETITEVKLKNDFIQFGEIEMISIIPEKKIGLVNFIDITSAINTIEKMKESQEYSKFKLNFGKDRCRNSPRQPKRDWKAFKYKQNTESQTQTQIDKNDYVQKQNSIPETSESTEDTVVINQDVSESEVIADQNPK